MFEKVNPKHPDKIADRIAGAIVDLAYKKNKNPKIAVEVLLGHGIASVIVETDQDLSKEEIEKIVNRISKIKNTISLIVPQDEELARNQEEEVKVGDNGIFRGCPLDSEEIQLSALSRKIYEKYPFDGKYILDKRLIICQSNMQDSNIKFPEGTIVNPLGFWTGGLDVDSGATNRKLGSDMGRSVTGGGLHGKDLSKGDVSINIYAFLKAQETNKVVEISTAIGDTLVDGLPYAHIVKIAREYIEKIGGFEKFAEWGLI